MIRWRHCDSRRNGAHRSPPALQVGRIRWSENASMPSYRIYFRSGARIDGRFDFAADDDQEAMILAELLHGACSDCCDIFELWHETRRVSASGGERSPPSDLPAEMRETLRRTCRVIRDGEWFVSRSPRLAKILRQLEEDNMGLCTRPSANADRDDRGQGKANDQGASAGRTPESMNGRGVVQGLT